MTSLTPAAGPESWRAAMSEIGYLYFPDLLDVEHVHLRVVTALTEIGWPSDGPFTRASFATVYPAVQRIEAVHALGHEPRLAEIARTVLGGDVFCHPAKAVRLIAPGMRAYATRAHQDFAALQVTPDVLTFWIALAPCDPARQGLRVLPGSHLLGELPVDPSLGGERALYVDVAADDPRWATMDYRPGDVVVFHSLTVHAGGPNHSDSPRLSVDVRYQRVTDPIRDEFTHPHGWPATPDWPELTGGWSTTDWVSIPDGVLRRNR
jgi:hypothetical protein